MTTATSGDPAPAEPQTSERLDADTAERVMSDLLCEDHVFPWMDHCCRTFYGVHRLFRMIDRGEMEVYGSINPDGKILGVAFGLVKGDHFEVHVLFFRKVDVKACAGQLEEIILRTHPEIAAIEGHIPESNRMCLRFAIRCGFVNRGICEDETADMDGKTYRIIRMRKDF